MSFSNGLVQPPTSYTRFYPGGFLLKSLHLSNESVTKRMFPSWSQGGTFLRLGVSRVDESNDVTGIHPDFGVATIAPEVMECRLWSGNVFFTGKGFAQLSEARIKRISLWQKRASGTWVKRGCLRVFWSWESKGTPPMPPSQEIRPCSGIMKGQWWLITLDKVLFSGE